MAVALLSGGCALDDLGEIDEEEEIDGEEEIDDEVQAGGDRAQADTPYRHNTKIQGDGWMSTFANGRSCLVSSIQRWSGTSWVLQRDTYSPWESCVSYATGLSNHPRINCRTGRFRTYVKAFHDGRLVDAAASAARECNSCP
jgi:hypothetical protein